MKIPPQAKLVFKGIIFDVYQWEQEMYDGSYETFEMLKRANTLQVIATQGENVLIAYEEQPTKGPSYTLLGGRQNEGEEPIDAAKREMKEEAGLVSDDWELYKHFDPYNKMDWTVYTYIARNCKKNAEPSLDAGEKIEVKTVNFDEFVRIATEEHFWGVNLTVELLKMQMEPRKLEEFKKKLFGK